MSDLIALLNTLLDKDGEILIPGIMEDVEIISPEEQKMYSNIDFDIDAYKNELGSPQLLHDKKVYFFLNIRFKKRKYSKIKY